MSNADLTFWTPVSFKYAPEASGNSWAPNGSGRRKRAFIEAVDNYFNFGNHKAFVVKEGFNSGFFFVAGEDHPEKKTLVATVLKIISVFTVIIPLFMLIAKAIIRATSEFNSFEKAYKIEPESTAPLGNIAQWSTDSSPMGQWLAKHGNTFFAHAINQGNVDAVLEEGILHSAAELTWNQRVVFVEPCMRMNNQYNEVRYKTDDEIRAAFNPNTLQQLEKIWKEHINVELSSDHYPKSSYSVERCNQIFEISETQNKVGFLNTLLFLDRQARRQGSGIDKRLSEVFAKCLKHAESIKSPKVQHIYTLICRGKIALARDDILKGLTSIHSTIRGLRNKIAWNYGPVVVLRGGAQHLISPIGINSIIQGEVQLKNPFENNGEFMSLDLQQEDTIILGPKALLQGYKAQFPNIHFLEDLTPAQRAFFNVPEPLTT